MFRQGGKNPHTVYWSDSDEPTDRFVCTAMTPAAAKSITIGLNWLYEKEKPIFVADLPSAPKREPSP